MKPHDTFLLICMAVAAFLLGCALAGRQEPRRVEVRQAAPVAVLIPARW